MARFVFRLESVLRQRRWDEQQLQRDLALRQAHLSELQRRLQHLNQQVQTANQDMRDNRLTGRLDLGFLTAHRRFLAAMQRGAIEIMRRMTIATRQVSEAQAAVAEAAKRRKTLEKLREKKFARWRAEQSRREVMRLDEVGMQLAYQDLGRNLEGTG